MPNLLNNPELWTDGDNTPPIWWNDTDARFEILAEGSSEGVPDGNFSISSTEELQPGNYIEFTYVLNQYAPATAPTPNVLVITRNNFTLVEVVDIVDNPTGTVRVDIQDAGFYQIQMAISSTLYYELAGFYSFDALITPTQPQIRNFVYELDKGWTFDGAFIPHFIIFNWYFGENPTVYTTMQKVRVHGLAKGIANLQVQTNGIQTDYREDFSSPEHFDLKNPYEFVSEEFIPATEYADLANRGLAIQLKFEGRNTTLTLPEPSHVLQVLVPQSSPSGSGFSSN